MSMLTHPPKALSPGRLWRGRRSRFMMPATSSLTFLLIGIVCLSASALSLVLSDGAPSMLALQMLGTIGIVYLAMAQWRALFRATAAARDATAKADRLEQELAKHEYLEEAWPHREERYRTPLDQLQDYVIFLLDAQGKPTSWNPGVRRVLGYEKQEFLQTLAADLYTAEDRQDGVPERDLFEAAESGRTSSDRWIVRKD